MAKAGSSTQTGESFAVPQPANQTSASIDPLSGILRSIWDVPAVALVANPPIGSAPHKGKAPAAPPPSQTSVPDVYPSDIGHPANDIFGGPLRLVPFNLSKPQRYPHGFRINPYSDVGHRMMGSFFTECYPRIPDEHKFQYNHLLRYLGKFYGDPEDVEYKTSWETNVNFHSNRFYIPLGKGKKFTDLEIVRAVREHDPELLKVSSLACAPDIVADQLLRKGTSQGTSEVTSEVTSQMSTKFGGIKPDVCLTGYHIGTLAEGTYRQKPEGGRKFRESDRPKRVLYALVENKWLPWPRARHIDLQGKINLHLDSLQFANVEAIAQTTYYSLLAYDLSKCRSAMALVNGDFTRILNLSHLGPEGKEVVLGGVTRGGDGGRRILVEADPALVTELRRRGLHCVSPEQFGVLAAGDPLFGMQWKAPNSLIADFEDWTLDREAKERLDATVYLNLALATHHPETVSDPPIDNHSLTHVIDANTSEKVAYQWLDVSEKMRGRREEEDEEDEDEEDEDEEEEDEDEEEEEEEDEEEKDDHEGNEENDKQGGNRRDEDNGNPDVKTGGPGGGAPGPGGSRSLRTRTRSDHHQELSSKRQKMADVSGEFLVLSLWCSRLT
ncbi:hypothetical protein I350_07879 [Cryptococcus amylolentus CBS 6273]|uniref:Uncharacterized protein n=1 Tax=Cryptococcus amylolentus CBS 6273 TaxID=1296118 RepID=A0A1E3JBI6_9TREE|nr:hypothetical protein I350_07879 [Cryptococcus amylolentus CBS 6273]